MLTSDIFIPIDTSQAYVTTIIQPLTYQTLYMYNTAIIKHIEN